MMLLVRKTARDAKFLIHVCDEVGAGHPSGCSQGLANSLWSLTFSDLQGSLSIWGSPSVGGS